MSDYINQIKKSELAYIKVIGEGAFGDVYQMKWDSPNGPIDVAAKKLRRKNKHELEIMSGLDHPNIVKLIGVVDEELDFMLILELCEGGSLRSYLKARNGRSLPEKQRFEWAEQAARPLEYLRKMKLIHKDVKSDNYMVTSQMILKLGDFGIAKNIDQTIDNATETASVRWMAPELLVKGVLSPKFDIFALAVVLWELWTGRFPWDGVQSHTVIYKVCEKNERLPIPEDCPEPIKELLRQCWQTEWKHRPDIFQVLDLITSAEAKAAAATQEARQRRIIAGPWNMVREFGRDGPGTPDFTSHMTLSPDGDVVITDRDASKIKIYSIKGEYKSSIHTLRIRPWQIAVSSDNTCFMTDGISPHITMYELSGKHRGSWASSCPDASSHAPVLQGLAIDHAGYLLLGDCRNMYLYRNKQGGAHVASIKVGIAPRYIAVTSQDTIVIADMHTAPQVINNTGQVLYTLKHPETNQSHLWFFLSNLHCQNGIIFISCLASGKVLCYNESGKYLGSMSIYATTLVMTSDSKMLLACDKKSVKVFTASST